MIDLLDCYEKPFVENSLCLRFHFNHVKSYSFKHSTLHLTQELITDEIEQWLTVSIF